MIGKAKILLVDDHAVVRAGFKYLLESQQDYEVSEASSSEEAYQLYGEIEPNVVVLDVSMPGMGGIEGLRRLRSRYPDARVLLLSMYDDPAFVARAMKMGAMGYISKNSAADSLVAAIGSVLGGRQYFSADIADQMQSEGKDYDSDTLALSTREFEIFRLLAEGRSVSAIADDLSLSPKTVSNHRSRLMEKLNLKTTAELVHFAIRQGIVAA
ncbi:MAG: response regulator transcription factor [Gammaproteobacteria bacterium]